MRTVWGAHTTHLAHTERQVYSLLTLVWGFVPSAAVGVGFYGNSETNDGMHQLIYSLDNANHTFSGMDELVRIVGRWLGTGTAHEISEAGTRVPVRSQEPSCTLSGCVMDAGAGLPSEPLPCQRQTVSMSQAKGGFGAAQPHQIPIGLQNI